MAREQGYGRHDLHVHVGMLAKMLHIHCTVNREIFVFKNLRAINFRVKKSSSASGCDEDFLTTKFF